MIPIKETAAGVVFAVQVLPRSSLCKVVGAQGDFLKIKITAPPVDGRANEEVIRFLAGIFGVKRDQVRISGGLKAKKKTIMIKEITKQNVEKVLTATLSSC
jgi:hypothetical protein